jgi:hypothetical protein
MRTIPVAAAVLLLACASTPLAPTANGGTRILFIGNSLTYVNDVPAMVAAIGRQVGDRDIAVAMVAFPNYALEDHWNEGTATRALAQQDWEFVVMQQGPSSLPENRLFLEEWTRRFAPVIRAAGGEPVLYQVWPHIQRRGDAPAVLLSYANAAAAVQGRLAPAGAAWDSALAAPDPLPVYSSDGLHASAYGSWLAAAVIYATVRRIDPRTLPDTLPSLVAAPPLPAARVRDLLGRAAAAMAAAR